MSSEHAASYRRSCLRVTLVLLSMWLAVSFCCSILLRDWLDVNLPAVGHAPFGFWMAQQGSIICFVLLLIAYAVLINRLDQKYGYDKEGAS